VKLYNFHRSSASYRVRIALALKGCAVDLVTVNLRRGDQVSRDYLHVAPAGLVPLLEDGEGTVAQSLAIIQYLDDRYGAPRLIPEDPREKACAWQLALTICCDIHPLNNLRVLRFLEIKLGLSESQRQRWYEHWVKLGLGAFEELLDRANRGGPFCLGEQLTLADICLVPQVANARRFKVSLERFPRILAIDAHCRSLPAFQAAAVPASDDPAATDGAAL
jgi:maleylacetoacetate isomerase